MIEAEPETVFEYFTDPLKLVRWMGTDATLDPRPGGVCRIAFAPEAVVLGEFVEVTPPRRIVFSWGWEAKLFAVPPASTEVEVDLTPDGDGTRVKLTHRRMPGASVGFHTAGWNHYLLRLAAAAAGADPGPDTMPERVDRRLITGA